MLDLLLQRSSPSAVQSDILKQVSWDELRFWNVDPNSPGRKVMEFWCIHFVSISIGSVASAVAGLTFAILIGKLKIICK